MASDCSDNENDAPMDTEQNSKHPVHSYFNFDEKKNRSVCVTCKDSISGKNPTNLINHLKKNGPHTKAKHHEEHSLLKTRYDESRKKSQAEKRNRDEVLTLQTKQTKQPRITEVTNLC